MDRSNHLRNRFRRWLMGRKPCPNDLPKLVSAGTSEGYKRSGLSRSGGGRGGGKECEYAVQIGLPPLAPAFGRCPASPPLSRQKANPSYRCRGRPATGCLEKGTAVVLFRKPPPPFSGKFERVSTKTQKKEGGRRKKRSAQRLRKASVADGREPASSTPLQSKEEPDPALPRLLALFQTKSARKGGGPSVF